LESATSLSVHRDSGCVFSRVFLLGAPRRGEPITFQRALNQISKRRDKSSSQTAFWGKKHRRLKQKDVVAVGSQLRTITGPALALSNQNEATLFDLMS
jgi:hypothetical protein